MRRSIASWVLGACSLMPAAALACSGDGWMGRACSRIDQIWNTGNHDLYLTGWAWHNRSTYSARKVKEFNEAALGGGYGRSIEDEDGDWQGLYAMAFLDSHRNVQPMLGYGFLKQAHLSPNWRLGAGYTVFLTYRNDIFKYAPFPGALPLVSASYRDASLFATYIPGSRGAGNVLFVFGKWSF